jgi:asparagine synthase (glutamine-hydrolysing)
MCGITGIFAKNLAGKVHMINLSHATALMERRGPNARGVWMNDNVGLGHRRLSIIDVRPNANQPMKDASGRYRIVFNGEIYNFKALRRGLIEKGVQLQSESDTEVLLYTYIHYGEKCLAMLNGFFAFAIYDAHKDSLFAARDRYGIKPLYYFNDDDKFLFSSDMQALLAYGIEKQIDVNALHLYLQLNYTPAPRTMIKGVRMLEPGRCLHLTHNSFDIQSYYKIEYDPKNIMVGKTYEQQCSQVLKLVVDSVERRMVSDVPLGTFLSGGIDSSIISGVAKGYKNDLQTFSIGYSDEPFFDETSYANMVAEKFRTKHTVFSLSNNDLYEHLFDILDVIDQPFADSSAIPTYILSKKTRAEVTVALSGDGADELFSGYNKHAAHLRAMDDSTINGFLRLFGSWLAILPKSRSGRVSNILRQLEKFGSGLRLNDAERYWRWAGILPETKATALLHANLRSGMQLPSDDKLKYLSKISRNHDFNDLLLADMQLVLPNDMLRKVDMMSMAHGLEVRVPFLDHELVDYMFRLPAELKINQKIRKRILQDAFRDLLPAPLYNRPKKGFEVPLLKWFRTGLKSLIVDDLLSDRLISSQGIFDEVAVRRLRKQLFSINPGDAPATIWALIVFQWWWKKYF